MGYERYTRGSNPQGDDYGRADPNNYGRDTGGGGDYGRSSARDYQAAGMLGGDGPRRGGDDPRDQSGGSRDDGGYRPRDDDRQREQLGRDGRDYYGGRGDGGPPRGRGDHDRGYGQQQRFGGGGERQQGRSPYDQQQRAQQQRGGQPQGYDHDDRGFLARAGDEVRSWFGDDEAERRREADSRYDDADHGGQRGRHERDHDYHSWRSAQIASLDRDYDEYRREHQTKFHNEFSSWRNTRQGQREMLGKVEEHMEVVGSDGSHVGVVDKVRGDRIVLTKNDADAGGRHHSIPSNWISTVDAKVMLAKSADEAKAMWKDEERNQATVGDKPAGAIAEQKDDVDGKGHVLGKAFPGTY